MVGNISVVNMPAPEMDRNEVLRYAGCRGNYETDFPEKCLKAIESDIRYSVCWGQFPVIITGDEVDFGFVKIKSAYSARILCGCSKAVVFAATVGIALDRIIAKYSKLSPSKSIMFQALGTERVESLCNSFCSGIKHYLAKEGLTIGVRFSPGYGDIPISMQKGIFTALDVTHNIGVSLTDSLIMVPSKSVTAIAGIRTINRQESVFSEGCNSCSKAECIFRKV